MPPPSTIRFGPFAPVAGVLICILVLKVLELNGPALDAARLAFILISLWFYRRIRQTDDGGLYPRNDLLEESSGAGAPAAFVSPLFLFVVSMQVPESDPIDVVVWWPSMRNVSGTLSPEHVLGRLARSRKDGGSLEPVNLVQDEFFMAFLHQFLKGEIPGRPRLQEEGRRKGEGWVSFIDERGLAAPVEGAQPDEEDIIGRFHVREGVIEPESYQPNARYRLLTNKGMFRLDYALRERLKNEIIARHAFRQAGGVASDRVM